MTEPRTPRLTLWVHLVGWWMIAWGGFALLYDVAMASRLPIAPATAGANEGLVLLFGVLGALLMWRPRRIRGWAIAALGTAAFGELLRGIATPVAWFAWMEGSAAAANLAALVLLVYLLRANATEASTDRADGPTHAAGGPLDRL